ncbi:helix-turn-helix domain-containing protein [Enterobacter mori]|uniref:helix-turn-helix domain-containing protein n=1 Tax=Enterobacter mori TaxID=539813 RepID=UPI001B8B2A52|nr:helix-turn-helix domain-containing protein [Enterobacter mori]MBS3050416.1 helix-turn-helix domain-containing protein [Enterobacter mori]
MSELNPQGDLSLDDQLILAKPGEGAQTLSFHSVYTGKEVVVPAQNSLFICRNTQSVSGDRLRWELQSISLFRLMEIIASIDTAMSKALPLTSWIDRKITEEIVDWGDCFPLSAHYYHTNAVTTIASELLLRRHPEFTVWCHKLRRYEAYGMMCFLLSSSEERDETTLSVLSQRYGVSATYFRQLYRENFKATAKRKMMNVRRAYAILKLIESQSSILDVGLEAGYNSAAHFTNDIKKTLGMTPSEIRNLEAMLYGH